MSYLHPWNTALEGKIVPRILLFFLPITVLLLSHTSQLLESRKWRCPGRGPRAEVQRRSETMAQTPTPPAETRPGDRPQANRQAISIALLVLFGLFSIIPISLAARR